MGIYLLYQQSYICIYDSLVLILRFHRGDFGRAIVVGQSLLRSEGFVLRPVIRGSFVVVIQEGFRQHVWDVFKNYVFVKKVIYVVEGIFVVEIKRHGIIREFGLGVASQGKQIQAVENIFDFTLFKRLGQVVIQLGGDAGAFDSLDGSGVKSFVKPFVIEVLRGGGTHKQAVVIEIADGADALIFLFGKDSFQRGGRPVVVEKRIK